MALVIEKEIDLTNNEHNTVPWYVRQLQIINEARDGELVQYYVDPYYEIPKDKSSCGTAVYDEDENRWLYFPYEDLDWGWPRSRISTNRVERLRVKAFPGIGAIAALKLAYRNISRIIAPVNRYGEKHPAPTLDLSYDAGGNLCYTILEPEKEEYRAYRIVMRQDEISYDRIVYELAGTIRPPEEDGTFECWCIGYLDEGQIQSETSNIVTLHVSGTDGYERKPFYTKAELRDLFRRVAAIEGTLDDPEVPDES